MGLLQLGLNAGGTIVQRVLALFGGLVLGVLFQVTVLAGLLDLLGVLRDLNLLQILVLRLFGIILLRSTVQNFPRALFHHILAVEAKVGKAVQHTLLQIQQLLRIHLFHIGNQREDPGNRLFVRRIEKVREGTLLNQVGMDLLVDLAVVTDLFSVVDIAEGHIQNMHHRDQTLLQSNA